MTVKKKMSMIGIAAILAIGTLFFCYDIRVAQTYGITYNIINLPQPQALVFKARFKGQVATLGYSERSGVPQWSLTSFNAKQKFTCYVNENDRNGKGVFFWIDCDDGSIMLRFKYYVEGNPYFLPDKIEYFRNIGYNLTGVLPELKVDCDEYHKHAKLVNK